MKKELSGKSYGSRCSKLGKQADRFFYNRDEGGLQRFFRLPQFFPDGNSLRAVLFTFSAAYAVSGCGGVFSKDGTFQIIHESAKFFLSMPAVARSENAGNVYPLGTKHLRK